MSSNIDVDFESLAAALLRDRPLSEVKVLAHTEDDVELALEQGEKRVDLRFLFDPHMRRGLVLAHFDDMGDL